MFVTSFNFKLIKKKQLHLFFFFKIVNAVVYGSFYIKFFYLYLLKCNLVVKPAFLTYKVKLLINSKVKWILVLNFFLFYNIIISLIPLKKLNFFFYPKKKTLFSLTRAPFIFKKSKEQFIINFSRVIILLSFNTMHLLPLNFIKTLIQFYALSKLPIKWSEEIIIYLS
jgi:hypothetical protein